MKIIDLKKAPELVVIGEAVETLKKGGVVVYPTETCYGIGVDATNKKAVEKILAFKSKRGDKPISMAVADQKMAGRYVHINEIAQNLYANFLPGPLTVVSKSRGKTLRALEAGTGNLGIRIPRYSLILKIIKKLAKPIIATSANQSGRKNPYSLADFKKYTSLEKQKLVDVFLDAGELPERETSTVVDTTVNELAILRQGEIKIDDLQSQVFISNSEKETKKIAQKILQKYSDDMNHRSLIFALQGELGAGKTQFVKGLARGLEIKANVNSPAFVLIKEYEHKKGRLFHLDTWRLEKGEELLDLGLEAMLQSGNVVAIEWLQKAKEILEKIEKERIVRVIWVTIEIVNENTRKIKYKL
ncbi:MAG: L-threonylcarbamoyladenylate synthase [Candidatus Shapirobacteria bacterium]